MRNRRPSIGGSSRSSRKLSKAVLVYEDLRASIIDLALKPGTRLDK